MKRMTTQIPASAPYRVFVELPHYAFGLISGRDPKAYVATGLRPGQLDSYDLYGSTAKFIVASALSSVLGMFFVMFGALGLIAPIRPGADALPILVGIGTLWLGATVWAFQYMWRCGNRTEAAIDELKKAGAIAAVPEDDRFEDLRRISRAIQNLQGEHGSSYDEQARKAVVAVIEQNRHQPNEKHLAIARSTASDPLSVEIRTRAMEAETAWGRDVSTAEKLILALEETAGIRTGAAA